MEEKKTIKLRLYTAVILSIIIILTIFYIIMFSINKHNADQKERHELVYINIEANQNQNIEKQETEDINVVATLEDAITQNSTWCGTFQLVWNDMVNNVVEQDIVFTPQLDIVKNLNKQTFTENDLSEESYYKVYDLLTLDLKSKIEKEVKKKFNEKSDIINQIDWSNAPKDNSGYTDDHEEYLFYAMLKKEFNFENEFDELENDIFGTKYNDIKYFGIDRKSDQKLYSQVEVLYYNSEDDFAIILNTKEQEQIILARGLEGNSFGAMYNDIVKKKNNYTGNTKFTGNDFLKVPNINLDAFKSFDELADKYFYAKDGDLCNIRQAMQTIKVELDKSGGKIKSEAAIVLTKDTTAITEPVITNRYFYLNDEFTMFLKEIDKDIPYFAANIEDITLFQN